MTRYFVNNQRDILKEFFRKFLITRIAYKTGDIREGTVFFAIKGLTHNGNDFIESALKQDVNLVFTDNKLKEDHTKNVFFLDKIHTALMISLEILYPKVPSNLIAVTGTNGKTSIVSFIGQMLTSLNIDHICIGTLGIESNKKLPTSLLALHDGNTVPNRINFRKILYGATKLRIKNVIFEISSHAIDQNRIGKIPVNQLGFSSFSQDHLDYHKTMEAYFKTKLSFLKSNLKKSNGSEVVLYDDGSIYSSRVKDFCQKQKIKFSSVGTTGDIKILSVEDTNNFFAQKIKFQKDNKIYQFQINVLGNFQVYNILVASKLLSNMGIDFEKLFRILPDLKTVNCRLENITDVYRSKGFCTDFNIFIDYAHTPDALKLTLLTLKGFLKGDGRLIVIFGCGGNKDVSKRPLMGKISSEIADLVIVTDDNPREENPKDIRRAIIEGIQNKSYKEYASRARAIENTIFRLKNNDILLIAGKGNENFQIIKSRKKIFSDKKIAFSALEKIYSLNSVYHIKSSDFRKGNTSAV